MREHNYFVYMIASISRVLYIGMTNNLHRRVSEHKNDLIDGFTSTYKCHRLVYYESFDDVAHAIDREKQLKRWNRTKKVVDLAQQPDLGRPCGRMVHAASICPRQTADPSTRQLIGNANQLPWSG